MCVFCACSCSPSPVAKPCPSPVAKPACLTCSYNVLATTPELSILKSLIDRFPSLVQYLSSEESFTLFAPSNKVQ